MIVGFSGKAGSGKTTLANFLQDEFGFVRMSFASPLKETVMKYFGLTEEDIKTKNPTARKILQGVGIMMREEVDKRYWIKQLEEKMIYLDKNIVIDDVRFENEADFIKRSGGILIRIERPGIVTMNHPSENELDDYDGWNYIINNNHDEQYMIYNFSDLMYRYVQDGLLTRE